MRKLGMRKIKMKKIKMREIRMREIRMTINPVTTSCNNILQQQQTNTGAAFGNAFLDEGRDDA